VLKQNSPPLPPSAQLKITPNPPFPLAYFRKFSLNSQQTNQPTNQQTNQLTNKQQHDLSNLIYHL